MKRGLGMEAAEFAKLAVSPVCKALISLYGIGQDLKKSQAQLWPQAEKKTAFISRAAVIGAGVMGGKIAWLLGNKGLAVNMVDINWQALSRAFAAAAAVYKDLVGKGRLGDREKGLGMHRIHASLDYRTISRTDFVIEAVAENLEVKLGVLSKIEKEAKSGAVIVSNTSSLSISRMAGSLADPTRFAGMHFFNPVDKMPLVEVIRGEKTSEDAAAMAMAMARRLGKTPVLVRDAPGFLVNRILMSYLNEACLLLEEGHDVKKVDALLVRYGLPMGPFLLLDEIGLDIAAHVGETMSSSLKPTTRTTRVLGLMKAAGFLGKKTGRGFYIHNGKKTRINPEALALNRGLGPTIKGKGESRVRTADSAMILDRCLLRMLGEAATCLGEKIVASPGELDLALVLGIGFPAFRGGLLRDFDGIGIENALERMEELDQRFPGEWKASPALVQMKGKRFYPVDQL